MKSDDKLQEFKEMIFRNKQKGRKILNEKYVTDNQGKTLLEYIKDHLDKKTENTLNSELRTLKLFSSYVKKPYKKITKGDIQNYFKEINLSEKKVTYQSILKVHILMFFKWLYDYNEKGVYPKVVSWMKIIRPEPKEILKKDLITTKEIQDILIPACHNFKEQCLISIMRETGARINEILKINLDNIRIENDKAFITLLNSKRGEGTTKSSREIVIIDSFRYLQNWLRDYPKKVKTNNSPLFLNRFFRRFTMTNTNMLLSRIKKETGFVKPINPHNFRHSSANETSKFLNEIEMRIRYGWKKGSQMVERYSHLDSDDVNDKMLIEKGRTEPKEILKQKEEFKDCPRCNENVNISKFDFCGRCGLAMNEKFEIKKNIEFEEMKQGLKNTNDKIDNFIDEFKNILAKGLGLPVK